MEQKNDEYAFLTGFWFGLLLAKSMGLKTDRDSIFNQLRSVTQGELTIIPSPDEALSDVRAELGRPLTEEELKCFHVALPKNRRAQDEKNREYANLILRLQKQAP